MSPSSFSRTSESERNLSPPESRRWLIWPFIALAVAVGLMLMGRGGLMSTTRAGMGSGHDAVGERIEQFDLQPLTGDPQPLTAADLQGKVTLVNFWGPWCPPCRIEFPILLDLVRHHAQEKDFQFVSVSCVGPGEPEDLPDETAAFLKEQKAKIPTWHDPTEEVRVGLIQDAGVTDFAYPTTVLTDRSGKIRGVWIGYSPGDEVAMSQMVSELLREKQK